MGGISVWLYLFGQSMPENKKIILIGLLSVIFVGVVWEIFEVHFGITFLSDGIVYIRDTFSDLILDLCGGIFGVLYAVGLNK